VLGAQRLESSGTPMAQAGGVVPSLGTPMKLGRAGLRLSAAIDAIDNHSYLQLQ
jgi:hypothetical protein